MANLIRLRKAHRGSRDWLSGKIECTPSDLKRYNRFYHTYEVQSLLELIAFKSFKINVLLLLPSALKG
ncbi:MULTISPECIES: hypothetical protein [Moorena]|uniref:Uncharacterized protein n=1 Tax=Moorena producens 3L TaxID=489825 RepID=F4XK17_9CYAN|nr:MULTISPECIES: hypothetical protein [Moorena]NEQ12389.1 hypothetical protein [Moorena sp. SIO3E2]NES87092.1 hypothetical protein [Moorena sp. SIO2B7]EGJ34976.1 hypothetical protein LYNGBM3L_10900 [Moorena producens 3L]NEP34303.1 hypothetical protein [Moorena sp. SIO3B2]NEQ11032.1 hypothetical protein [Moorena sp. SIO4E2]